MIGTIKIISITTATADATDADGAQTPSAESPQLGLRPPLAGALAVGAGVDTDADAESADTPAYQPLVSKITPPRQEYGLASWYGGQFHGRKTANGERFNSGELTAAHRSLAFGTRVCVRFRTATASVALMAQGDAKKEMET